MLSQLYIENIAVIEKVCIDFHPGLNILTGETGAGKSILINAINSILGKRTSKDIIRSNTDKACIIANFESLPCDVTSYLKDNNFIENIDDAILVERSLTISGRTSCKINLKPVTTAILKDIGNDLITIHGQNDSYDLLSKKLHIEYIDNLAQNQDLLTRYVEEFKSLIDIKNKLKTLSIDEDQKLRTIDLLKYQIDEIESAGLQEDELETLTEQKSIYLNAEKISSALKKAGLSISNTEDSGILEKLQSIIVSIESISDCFPKINTLVERLNSLYYELDDCNEEINEFSTQVDYDPNKLEDIDSRLDLIYKLSRKYGSSIKDMLDFLDKCKKELNEITLSEESRENLESEYEQKLIGVKKLALELSDTRREAAKDFCEEIKKELEFLDMPHIKFTVSQFPANLSISGCDDIQFMISTNPGEDPKPLSKIASGGELSRIMLAIKAVLSDKDSIPTLIFDEVDTGISGSAARKVGEKLKQISKHHQVICITHSAQVAAFADEHFLIEKKVKDNRSFTSVKKLSFTDRKYELARIIAGNSTTENTLNTVHEMIINANNN